ncbi:zinc finger MYM-type protein 1-like [Photinus pyralis]|uniref:zinc finger MYM-type protein 1-like n=1 Tax=Photinus pyralis TaxID=7054 RepID=UPI001266F0D9|nr:zinc finger MYM-type protein 1-like [Photinus pyralis]
MKRRYESGAAKRKKREERENINAQHRNSLQSFLVHKEVNTADSDTTTERIPITVTEHSQPEIEIIKYDQQTASCSFSNEKGETNANHDNYNLLDISQWPDTLTEDMIQQVLNEKPKDIGDPTNSGILVKYRDRTYIRHLSENNFYRTKPNGTKEKREWLIFSETSGSVYCYICKMFSKKKTQFFSGCSDWKNISAKISEHENSNDHRLAMCIFCKRSRSEGRIDSDILKQVETEQQYWRAVLKRVVITVKFLASQGLAFRGQQENKSNYFRCLEYLAEFDPFIANHLSKYGHRGQGSVSYLSNTTCDEIINIMGDKLRKSFIEEVKTATYFSLIIDSTPDISHVDQLSIVLRYVLPDGQIKERFFGFIDIYSHHSENLEHVVTETLSNWGIDITKCRGQSYDNAANMAGKYSGLQARIKQHSANAEYIPCSSHSLNLVLNTAAESSRTAISYFDFVQNLYVWFSASTQRWNILQNHLRKNACCIQRVSDTRWSARADAVFALYKSYSDIRKALMDISDNQQHKLVARVEAKGLVKKMNLYEIAIMTVLWNKLLQRMNATSKSFQNPEFCLSTTVNLLTSLKSFISSEIRNGFDILETDAARFVEENCIYQDEEKRSRKPKLPFDESAENNTILSGRENFIVNTVNIICDTLMGEIDNRIKAYTEINNRFGLFFNFELSKIEVNSMITKLITIYTDDIDAAVTRDELLQFLAYAKEECLYSPMKMYEHLILCGLKSTFPNVETLLRIYHTIPISNASGERSFSALKRIKTYLRNSVGQERLSNLAILHIESEETGKCNFDDEYILLMKLTAATIQKQYDYSIEHGMRSPYQYSTLTEANHLYGDPHPLYCKKIHQYALDNQALLILLYHYNSHLQPYICHKMNTHYGT